jgi:hypothetical protein
MFQVKMGHPEHGHALDPHADDRGREIDHGQDRAPARQHQAHDPQVTSDARRVHLAGQRRVGVPAERRRPARGEEADQQDDPAEHEKVVAEDVQRGEGHVRGADVQRHDLVGEPDEHRGGEHQQHDRAVHGEQLVVLLVGHDIVVRAEQLRPHDHGHQARDQEEPERVLRYRWPMILCSVVDSQLASSDPLRDSPGPLPVDRPIGVKWRAVVHDPSAPSDGQRVPGELADLVDCGSAWVSKP